MRLAASLLRRARAYARREGVTLTTLIERALAAYLKEVDDNNERRVALPSFGRGGVRDDVRLDRNAAMLDVMNAE